MTKTVIITGKIIKRDGKIVSETLRGDLWDTIGFGRIGRERFPNER